MTMEHIAADFDLKTSDLPFVENLTDPDVQPPDSWEAFQNYPRENGWTIREDTLNPTLLKGSRGNTVGRLKFIQSWLFFGMIMTVVQRNGRPIIGYDELVESDDYDGGGSALRVTTKDLPEALKKWREWECKCKNISDVRLRMVRAESVLDAARRIVRANYSHHMDDETKRESTTDSVTLSIMVLGETLSMIKAQIMKKTKSHLKGWHSEDDNGWGPPSYIYYKMIHEDWCKRTMHLWWSQLRGNATLMLASYVAYSSVDRFKGDKHKECTREICKVTPRDSQENYDSAHALGCTPKNPCGSMQGPEMTIVRLHLQEERIPLLQFKYAPTEEDPLQNLELRVLEKPLRDSAKKDYATISHVWSDGFGNENANTLHRCQLGYIRRVLDKIKPGEGWETPFWMDTLIIPIGKGEDDKILRKRAIKQIFHVFKESAYTIVLDAGLTQMNAGHPAKPAVAAMRILGSSWMRRLWTLQEAFLSKKIYFAFADTRSKEFNELSRRLGSNKDVDVTTSLLNMVNNHLKHLVMSHEYGTRDKYLFQRKGGSNDRKMPQEKAAFLVASSWKAARWRTTSNEYHETLALATLLDLDYENTDIAEAGLQQPEFTTRPHEGMNQTKDNLVRQFWTQFNTSWPNSIPPGIIFLPGERVNLTGFGWAPRTWMTARPIDHPDPLTLMTSTAELDTAAESGLNGLKVRYPGFLLDPQDRGDILGTNASEPKFWFPTGPTFLDWYAVEFTPDNVTKSFLTQVVESRKRLGIIISRMSPGDSPAEVGLLVQIRESKMVETEIPSSFTDGAEEQDPPSRLSLSSDADMDGKPLYCEILGRVKVSRETRAEFRTRNRARFWWTDDDTSNLSYQNKAPWDGESFQKQRDFEIPQVMTSSSPEKDRVCLAEELGPEQVWFVDGFFPQRNIEDTHTEMPSAAPSFSLPTKFLSLFRRPGQPDLSNPTDTHNPGPRRSATVAVYPTHDPQPEPLLTRLRKRTTFGFNRA